jgi:hypothetical protein
MCLLRQRGAAKRPARISGLLPPEKAPPLRSLLAARLPRPPHWDPAHLVSLSWNHEQPLVAPQFRHL